MATIRIYRGVPLTESGENCILSDAKTLLTSLSRKMHGEPFEVSYIKAGAVELPIVAYNIIDCNYLSYAQGNRIHFAFIDSVEWRSINSCVVFFTEDYFTTYINDISINSAYLEETNSTAVYNSHYKRARTLFAPQHYSELFERDAFLDSDTKFDFEVSEWRYLVYVPSVLGTVGALDPSYHYSKLPLMFECVVCNTVNDLKAFSLWLFAKPVINPSDMMVIYAIPKFIANRIDTAPYEATIVGKPYTFNFVVGNHPPISFEWCAVPSYFGDNYKIYWNDDISYIELNLFGEKTTFSPSDLCDRAGLFTPLTVKFAIGDNPSLSVCLPDKRDGRENQIKVIATTTFPSLSFSRSDFERQVSNSAVRGVANSVATQGASFIGDVKNIAMTAINSMKNARTDIRTNSGADYCGLTLLYCRFISLTPDDYTAFEEYTKKYGYVYNIVYNASTIFDDNGGAVINGGYALDSALYIKLSRCVIKGDVPAIAREVIYNKLANGVRLFKSISSMESDTL